MLMRVLAHTNVLVAVVVEAVVAAQSGQSSQPDGVGEEDLSAGVDPHLEKRSKVAGVQNVCKNYNNMCNNTGKTEAQLLPSVLIRTPHLQSGGDI